MAHCASDIDGTISSNPYQMMELLTALKTSGHRITLLTGVSNSPVTQQDFDEKVGFLMSLGCSSCWDDMVIFGASGKKLAKMKAQWLSDNHVGIFIDNNVNNAERALPFVPLVLVPWATQQN